MIYLFVSAILIVVVILYLDATSKNRQRKRLDKIRASWGVPKTEEYNLYRIGKYAEMSSQGRRHVLSKQTLDDIDFHQLFAFVDRTTSRVGQQYLFRQILFPFWPVDELKRMDSLANMVAENVVMREDVQKQLVRLDHPGVYYLCNLIDLQFGSPPAWFKYLYVNLILSFALAVLAFKFPLCLILLIIPAIINMHVHYWNKGNMASAASFPELSTLMDVSREISAIPELVNSQVQKSLRNLKGFKRKLMLLNSERTGIQDELSQLGYYLSELIKGIFLVEVFAVFSLAREVEKNRSAVSVLLDFVGEVDTSVSIASLRAGCPGTCVPRFIESPKELSATEVYHPLIRNCVKNNIKVNGKSVLITGSNMSGKTTFLRTVAINSILAQSIYTCFAREFVTPFLRQFSSIRIDDDLFKGRSYFFEEVNLIGLFIEEMQSDYPNLFILDEVFKGTNSVERSALAKAILSYLNRGNNLVMVSTHDIELSGMLKDGYDVYHFSETIENGQLHFDHALKPGPLKTRNAIRLLELGNFPEEITREARSLASDPPGETSAQAN